MEEERPIAILAVDDEPGVLTLVRRCLKDQRIMLVEASSGERALAVLSTGSPPDLLITDLRMPGMEGDELARQARMLVSDLKVLYLTGHADRLFGGSQELRAEEAYLDKPFMPAARKPFPPLVGHPRNHERRRSGEPERC